MGVLRKPFLRMIGFQCFVVKEIKNRTNPIAKAYGIGRMGLFGAYARGEAKDDSDVDLYTLKYVIVE